MVKGELYSYACDHINTSCSHRAGDPVDLVGSPLLGGHGSQSKSEGMKDHTVSM